MEPRVTVVWLGSLVIGPEVVLGTKRQPKIRATDTRAPRLPQSLRRTNRTLHVSVLVRCPAHRGRERGATVSTNPAAFDDTTVRRTAVRAGIAHA
ncbi:hypothetical protein DENSPDRAFT_837664 [Dentipellis sp. KUC8613]|nr:hypothetical protein DENSPDRAFT_837664 [Dentipellis sp. KUC8613]